jgi:hypothetical protein
LDEQEGDWIILVRATDTSAEACPAQFSADSAACGEGGWMERSLHNRRGGVEEAKCKRLFIIIISRFIDQGKFNPFLANHPPVDIGFILLV